MSSPKESGDSLTGSHLFGFDVQERLGAGGMGVVYRAVDRQLGRSVALKVLTDGGAGPDSPERERFLREARAASALDHPNIGTIYSVQELPDGRMCIVMAYYDGKTLADRMKEGRMSLASSLAVAIQVADGLAAAHERGIIHRDIKPSNIMLGSGGIAKVVDFGLAKLMEGEDKLTKTSIVLGTVSYMSPEQARGRELDARTDIWSVGVMLYEMLSGRVPFPGSNTVARLYSVVHEEPEGVDSGLPELDACVRKALAKKPRERYESMAEFAAELRRVSATISRAATEETQILRTAETVILPTPRSRRLKIGYVITGCVLALLGAGWLYPPARNAVLDRFQTGAARGHTVLAILPFTSDQGPELSALAAGMSQALSARLGGIERLRESITMVAPSELMSRKVDGPAGAMKNLGATIAVGGRLRREASGRLRLVLQVVDRNRKDPADYVIEDAGGDLRMLE